MTAVPDQLSETPRPRFSDVSAVRATESTDSGTRRFEAAIHPDWTIGDKPNGGYLLAMLGRAAAEISDHPHAVAASAYYLRAPEPGPVSIDAVLLRRGRSASQVRTTMRQGELACVEA